MFKSLKNHYMPWSIMLFIVFFVLQAYPVSADEPAAANFHLPTVVFAYTPVKVELASSARLDAEKKAFSVSVFSLDKTSEPLCETSFDSSGTAEITFPGSGRYRVSVKAVEWTGVCQVRALPGILTILPPVIAILLALVFRQVLPALFVGIWFGTSLLAGLNPVIGIVRLVDTYLVQAMSDKDHVRIIIFCMTLGGMVGLITRSGGTAGLVNSFSRCWGLISIPKYSNI